MYIYIYIYISIILEYINISIYSPLSASSYVKLPVKLRNAMKGLININNNDNKSFLWCHVRHLNPLKTILHNVICYENNFVYPGYISHRIFEDHMDLLLITDQNKSNYIYIKDFNRFMYNKTKCKTKKYFLKFCSQYFTC